MAFETKVRSHQRLVSTLGFNDAYLVMAVALFIEEADPESLASAGLTEGGNDKSIDFIYHDREARRLVFAQGYMNTSGKKDAAPSSKAADLNTACAWLVSGDVNQTPPKLQGIIKEFRSAIANSEIDFIDLLYVHNLPESINVNRELQTAEEHLRTALSNKNILVKSHELGRTKLEHLFAAQDSHIEVTDEVPFPAEIGISQAGATWKAGVATVSGDWIHSLYSKYGDKLYSANYRGFLGADGRRRVNSGIRESVEKTPTDFWAFNNGITVLTLGIERTRSKTGENVKLRGISVINGAQTTGSIGSVDATRAKLREVKVLCRIIECSDQDTIDQVVKYNNTQNVITTWDQFSNDQEQKRLNDEFAEIGYAYIRKRGFISDGSQISIEQVIQPLIAYHGRPQDASRGKNQLFVQKQLYSSAFDGKKARHVLFVYTLSNAIDNKRLELKKKSNEGQLIAVEEKQIAFLRNLNFKPFLISVVANSLETIVGRPCDPLTVGFRTDAAKGSTIAELAARWTPVVDTFLPLLTAVPGIDPESFQRRLSAADDFLKVVKVQMDAMLSATGAADKHTTFAGLIAST